MFILQKIIQQIKFLTSSKRGIYTFQFTTVFILGISIYFMVKDKPLEQNDGSPSIIQRQANTPNTLAPLFSEQNLNNNLIPQTNQKGKNSYDKVLESAFLKNDLQIFGFDANAKTRNPINTLSDLIQEMYSVETPLLAITQEINASIFQTFEDISIENEDILFAENAVRLTQKAEPYPFITLELAKKNSKQPYFQSKKTRDKFVSTLSHNLAKRNLSGKSASKKNTMYRQLKTKVKLVDEKQFLYITFNNIISHVIRLEPRKERIAHLNPLKNNNFYFTLIIDDVGENFALAQNFMELPFPVILSIWPKSTHGTSIATLAHEKGLPVFLHQPMEPMPNKNIVPKMGQGGLMANMSQKEIIQVLQKNILAVPYLRGVNNHMGSKFTTNTKAIDAFLLALKSVMPHILVVDSLTHSNSVLYSRSKQHGFLTGKRNYFIDNNDNVSKALEDAYNFAKKNGHAYVIGHARQKTFNTLLRWKEYKDENIIFALPTY